MKRQVLTALLATMLCVPLFAQTGRVKFPGMAQAGTITRDARGIAHVFALNERDMLFLQGYVHAQDRFFQMDFNRRLASGTLAELVGQSAIASDVQLRTLGLRRAAEASLARMRPETRNVLEGYAAGVNAGLASGQLPLEYGGLEITQVAAWNSVDSVVIAKLIAFSLSFDLDIDRTVALLTWQGVGDAAGFDGTTMFFEDLFRIEPFGKASTVPDATGMGPERNVSKTSPDSLEGIREAARAVSPAALELAKKVSRQFQANEFLREAVDRDHFAGSNEWGISGQLTTTGRPMIANDPHLALDTPSTFYPMGLQAGPINVFGMGFPGAPYVIQGHSPDLGWGSTNNPLDVTDAFIEELVIVPAAPAGLATRHGDRVEWLFPIVQTFRANVIGDGTANNMQTIPSGGPIPPATLIVPRRNAPILAVDTQAGTAISVQYTGFNATQEIEFFRQINRASTIEEFRDALVYFDFGSQNWAVVDSSGDYGYFTSGEAPLREDLQAGTVKGLPPFFLRDGNGGNDWIRELNPPPGQATYNAILPFSEMPQVINPPAGYFVNANNDPAGTNLDNNAVNQLRPGGGIYYLNAGYDGFRGTRITQMIEEKIANGGKISFADMQAMQADTVLLDAQYFVPWIEQAFANAQTSTHPLLSQFAASPAIGAAIQRLSNWNFSTPTGIPQGYDASDVNGQLGTPSATEIAHSVSATIYSVWRGRLIANTMDALLGGIEQQGGLPSGFLPRPGNQETMNSLRHLFDNWEETRGVGAAGLSFFNLPPAAGNPAPEIRRDILILQSLADAMGLITSEAFAPAFNRSNDMNTWNWGKLHRLVLDHPLGGALNIPPAGGAFPQPLPGLPGIPVDGGFGAVDASAHGVRASGVNSFMFGSGPVQRFVAEGRTSGIVAETSLPGGTSGNVASPFYLNLLPMWLTNETFPTELRPALRIPWIR